MAEENEAAIEEEEAIEQEYELDEEGNPVLDEDGNPIPLKKGKKKKMILVVVLLLVLIGGGIGGAVMMGVVPSGGGEEMTEEQKLQQAKIVYMDLDEFLVNLNNPGRQVSFLKMTVTLELPNLASQNAVQLKLPRIRDSFQVYLRELRNSDLQGSAGIQRLREELLLRINKVLAPEQVTDILFKEMIVQ